MEARSGRLLPSSGLFFHVFQERIGAIAAEDVLTKISSGYPFSALLVFRVPFALPVRRESQTGRWLPLLKHD
jgi:hypothetical protein